MQRSILMKKINLKNILAISFLLLWPLLSKAESFIRDSEIESVISEVMKPLVKASGLKDTRIILIQNMDINAFTAGGKEIFVNTGLIARFPDIDVFKGVIAHEMGHILGHHVARRSGDIKNLQKKALAGIALGIAGAIASGNPEVLAAGAIGSGDAAEKSFLRYSRTYESSADQAAYKLLEKAGDSAIGMKKLFEYFLIEASGKNIDPYLQTHPISSERLYTTKKFLDESKYKESTSNAVLKEKFDRASYKLLAFTHPDPELLLSKLDLITSEDVRQYISAICNMRLSKFKESVSSIDRLLIQYPNDPYYNELKGEIFIAFGKKDAIKYFEKASNLVPNDPLIKFSSAIVAFNTYRYDNKEKLKEYIPHLKNMKMVEPDYLPTYYYLAQYYGLLDQEHLGKLYLAIFYDKQDMKEAKRFAKAALTGLKKESPEYYWAMDIVNREY